MLSRIILTTCAWASLTLASAPAGPWDDFNFAPSSRDVYPASLFRVGGTVANATTLVGNQGSATFSGNGSFVTLDFGKEVGGVISLNIENTSLTASLSLAFTESSVFANPFMSDDSVVVSPNLDSDGVLAIPAPLSTGLWTQPMFRLRGGFRYLTVALTSSDDIVTISNLSVAISFMPQVDNLRDYTGYFYASDPLSDDNDILTKVWYAGAYTLQATTIAADQGRQWPPPPAGSGWFNNATSGVASPILVDGAKRDRTVWPGDLGIAVPTQFVALNDLATTRNSLDTLFQLQDPTTGGLPYAGPAINNGPGQSDTYHGWTLVGVYNYVLYSGDTEWANTLWHNYTAGVQYLANKMDSTGLLNATGSADWGRLGGGGYSISPNVIYYKVLLNSIELAGILNETTFVDSWTANATALKQNINENLWLPDVGMFRDNTTSSLTPQDGNSLAVLFNLTTTDSAKQSISEGLTHNWNEIGAVAPELPDTIAPFVGGFEIQAHFEAGQGERALDLMRRQWGYMLTTNLSVQSTLIEGFTANGSLFFRSTDGYEFDESYTSHAHGWSTGPTSALTYYILGLTVTAPAGSAWRVAPHVSGLGAAEGGFTTNIGWFGVKWTANATAFVLDISVPDDTAGTVDLPFMGNMTVDGLSVEGSKTSIALQGGNHTIIIDL